MTSITFNDVGAALPSGFGTAAVAPVGATVVTSTVRAAAVSRAAMGFMPAIMHDWTGGG